jgi:hypothetical protein
MFELTISLSWWMVGFVKDLNDFPEISSSSVLSLSRSVYYFLSNMLKPFKRYFEILYVCLFVYVEFCTLWYLLCFPHHMIHYSFEFAVRLFQLKLWVRTPFMARYSQYSIMWKSTPPLSINETDRHNISEILLKVALNTITLTQFRTLQ